jgi:hypothetical protein
VTDADALLAAYDAQLRAEAEFGGALDVERVGPLLRGYFPYGGFVSYRDLDGYSGPLLDRLIADTVAHFADGGADRFEWKTRGHDSPADLGERLIAHGLVAEEVETVMIGEAAALASAVALPAGVTLRRIDDSPDRDAALARACAMQEAVFGGAGPGPDDVLFRIEQRPGLVEFWVAEADDTTICAGRLDVVAGTDFAGLWGGATLPAWRGRGVYRALTAARARSAVRRGVRYLQSDCTAMSRPILEPAGLVAVTTTTPYVWTRPRR